MIKVENLSIKFDDTILFEKLSFTIESSEMVCIKGGSGTGKTSLLKAILGFTPVSNGTIVINNLLSCEKNIEQIRRSIAWIPQELALPFEWVNEMVALPFSLKANKHISFDKIDLMKCFYELGLDPNLYDKKVNEISGGQRQRIMIAVSALLEKNIIILDEPTSALDSESCKRVIEFLQKLKRSGKTIMIVSHDPQIADACDRTITLKKA